MNNKERKKLQKEYAKKNITLFLSLLKDPSLSQFHKEYVKTILSLSQMFNIRLTREEKLQFCKQCLTPLSIKNKCIRLNPKTRTIDHICKECGYRRRFQYLNN
jgi:RNase P subunit RPR2